MAHKSTDCLRLSLPEMLHVPEHVHSEVFVRKFAFLYIPIII